MDAAFELRVMRLYDAMLDQPPTIRRRWLEEMCAADPATRAAVQALADAEADASAVPTVPPGPRQPAADEGAGPERIGHYRLVGELGRGGMGIVYLAERDDGLFEHRVAIKLIRGTVFSARALAQFAVERRVLARLRHPHIAQILDGGVTGDGASYIVMERIAGEPITAYCDARAIDLAGRLTLFREAADAIEHAHRNLIVHADIKPSNVLVEDGFGVKLLDFGIARLLDEADATDAFGSTPGYASPTRDAGLPPTPADDVYAAGVLLRALIADVAGGDADLSAIVAKAAAADPASRYGTIAEFARDIERWRSHRPILASAPTRMRRLRLYWRRHRTGVLVAGLASVGLVVAFAAILSLYVQSERRRALADTRYEQTRALANYIIGDVDPELMRLPGALALRRRMVDRTGRYLRALETDRLPSRTLMLDVAAGYLSMARIYGLDPSGGIGDFPAAWRSLRHAQALLARVAPDRGGDDRLLRLQARAKLIAASEIFVAPEPGTLRDGLAALRAAQALLERHLADHPGDTTAQLELWRAEVMAARAYAYLGDGAAGRAIVETNLYRAATPVHDEAQRAERDFILDGSYLLLAEAYEGTRPARALFYFDHAVAHVAEMRRRGISDWQNDFVSASSLAGRAAIEVAAGRRDAAVRDYLASLGTMEAILRLGPNHEIAAFHAYTLYRLADLYGRLGRSADGRRLSDRAIAWLRADLAAAPGSGPSTRLLAMALQDRGYIERSAHAPIAACRADERADAAWRDVRRSGGLLPIDLAADGPVRALETVLATDCGHMRRMRGRSG